MHEQFAGARAPNGPGLSLQKITSTPLEIVWRSRLLPLGSCSMFCFAISALLARGFEAGHAG
jgi:hypothetical protein